MDATAGELFGGDRLNDGDLTEILPGIYIAEMYFHYGRGDACYRVADGIRIVRERSGIEDIAVTVVTVFMKRINYLTFVV